MQYNAVQYSAVQCSAVQCSAMQYNAVQYSTVQSSAVQCNAVQYSTVQYNAVKCSAVQCSTMQCSAVQCNAVQYRLYTTGTLPVPAKYTSGIQPDDGYCTVAETGSYSLQLLHYSCAYTIIFFNHVFHRVLLGKPEGSNHWGDLSVDGWIILGWIFRRWDVGYMDWIGLAQDRDRWRTFVGAVMNLRVP